MKTKNLTGQDRSGFILQMLGVTIRLLCDQEVLIKTKLVNITKQSCSGTGEKITRVEIEKALDTTPSDLLGFGPSKETQIREAIEQEYYHALDTGKHGGVAQNKAFERIQNILGMHWERS